MTDGLEMVLFYEKRLAEEKTAAEARGDRLALGDVEAKMAILQQWQPPANVKEKVKDDPSPYGEMDMASADAVDHIVRILVAVYREHEEWRVDWAAGRQQRG